MGHLTAITCKINYQKLWISTSHSSQLDCFQMKPPKSLRWHPAKWKSPSWSMSIANPNMCEWWPHSKARARPRDHVWRLINALGCNSTNLMRFSSLCPTSRAIPLRLLPKEQRPLDPPWPGATSQAQKRCRTSGFVDVLTIYKSWHAWPAGV